MRSPQPPVFAALTACVAACHECFAGSLAEPGAAALGRGIQLSRDCAELCQLVAGFVARGAEHTPYLLRAGAELCRACADEVTQYPYDYTRRCAEAGRQAEDACRTAY